VIGYNQIINISPLSTLANLTVLSARVNQIADISALSGMINLTNINLGSNNISDISILSGLTNLTTLPIYDNQISDISALSGLINLRLLWLSGNQFSNISALSGLTNLTDLRLSSNGLKDISVLSDMINLTNLQLHYNQITDISPLSGLTNLTNLRLYSNQISEISFLSELTSLASLYLYGNPLNPAAYCLYLPLIEDNNPGIDLRYSPNPNPTLLTGDCDGDCYVDFYDFDLIGSYWQEIACGDCGGADQTEDNNVDENDLKVLTDNWLQVAYIKFYEEPLDDDPNWTTQGEWEFGEPNGDGGIPHGYPDPSSGYTSTNVYGVNLSGNYSTAVGGPYYLTTSAIDCSYFSNISLKFSRWLNIDRSANLRSFIEVSNDGTTWTKVWQHAGNAITDDSWQVLEYDISEIADYQATVYISWSYEIWTNRAKPYSGWNIDDVELWGNP
jgi:hypothetical protein